MVSEHDVLSALGSLPGPDGATPLAQSGALSGITIKDGKVYVSISVDPRRSAELEPVRAAAEKALKKLPGVTVALVSLTAEKLTSAPPKPVPPRGIGIPGVSHIVAVASGKGGVGKSTCCVNLALGLASLGWRTGILDADVYGPSLPRLLGLKARPETQGRAIRPLAAYGVKGMS